MLVWNYTYWFRHISPFWVLLICHCLPKKYFYNQVSTVKAFWKTFVSSFIRGEPLLATLDLAPSEQRDIQTSIWSTCKQSLGKWWLLLFQSPPKIMGIITSGPINGAGCVGGCLASPGSLIFVLISCCHKLTITSASIFWSHGCTFQIIL